MYERKLTEDTPGDAAEKSAGEEHLKRRGKDQDEDWPHQLRLQEDMEYTAIRDQTH